MDRFETAWRRVALVVFGAPSVGIALWTAYQYTSLETVLAGLATAIAGGLLYLVYSLHEDLDEQIDELETKVDVGFEEALSSIDDADVDEYATRTDGSGWEEVRGADVEKVEFSGVGSVAGAAVGGAIGALFGPAGAGIGAIIGAAAGGGKEYQDLKERHQRRLERAAWVAVQRMSPFSGYDLMLDDIRDSTTASGDYWVFEFSGNDFSRHQVRISKQDGSVEYRPVEG